MKRLLAIVTVLLAVGLTWAQTVTGEVFATDDLLDDLADAGWSVTREEGPYRQVTGAGLPDGGWDLPDGVVLMDSKTPFGCACSTGSSCTVPLPDGGRGAAPLGQTLQPGWSGSGCTRKPCVEMAGQESSWPDACSCPGGGC